MRERERERQTDRQTDDGRGKVNRKVNGGRFSDFRPEQLRTHGLHIEIYQQQFDYGLWLVGRHSGKRPLRWSWDGKQEGKGSWTPAVELWRQDPEHARARNIAENEKNNVKICVSLFRSATVYFPSVNLKWLSQFILCFSFFSDYRVVANKLRIKRTCWRRLCVRHFFSRLGYNGGSTVT